MIPTMAVPANPSLDALQNAFVKILPTIERYGGAVFRHLPECRKQEALQEMRSVAWRRFVGLARRGKDAAAFLTTFMSRVARSVRSGRYLCGQAPGDDVMSWIAQERHGFGVESLPQSSLASHPWHEALLENSRTDILDQVWFRIDFARWRSMLSRRDRRLVDHLMMGERPSYLAKRFGLTPGRVTQLRQKFHDDWQRFQKEVPATEPLSA
jgi:hypothetical protein